ncbi:S41 family peptidase [Sphingobacterium paludis]|uniref:C-terminal processing protease CtpA/Prc n=1 Tax=Sphingobacterium paludis TaxID=1476465 RepID=A0A4V3E224_9SPHI|nr:S41 family peptidase [Sphingobacterium paludis]TDS14958.1 C-terminal processing protease CtpA/Prc [Sphingobacterium paludis]
MSAQTPTTANLPFYGLKLIGNLFGFVLVFLSTLACKKDTKLNFANSTKSWILDSMNTYYLWKDEISPNFSAKDDQLFFNSLLSKSDKYSYYEDLDNPTDSRSFNDSFGFRFTIVKKEFGILGVVNYVAEVGAAHDSGIKRGMLFSKINGQSLTKSLSDDYVNNVLSRAKLLLTECTLNDGILSENKNYELSPGHTFDNPIRMPKVFVHKANRIGYVFIGQFQKAYIEKLIETTRTFKDQAIDELILDLRYNTGGDLATMALLAYLTSDISLDNPFLQISGNQKIGTKVLTLRECLGKEISAIPTDNLQRVRLNLGRIYVLTGISTASSSEAFINCVRPYMELITVGSNTYGKDLGILTINSRSSLDKNIAIHPVVFKLGNHKGLGGYSKGLSPDIFLDEFDEKMYELGDPREKLLRHTLGMSAERRTGVGTKSKRIDNPYFRQSFVSEKVNNVDLTEVSKITH